MKEFIKVTSINDIVVHIRISDISAIRTMGRGCMIYMSSGEQWCIKESDEEIYNIIAMQGEH